MGDFLVVLTGDATGVQWGEATDETRDVSESPTRQSAVHFKLSISLQLRSPELVTGRGTNY